MATAKFDGDRCKGCGLCVEACPKKIISLSSGLNAKGYHPAGINAGEEDKGLGCAACAMMCPDVAITVE